MSFELKFYGMTWNETIDFFGSYPEIIIIGFGIIAIIGYILRSLEK